MACAIWGGKYSFNILQSNGISCVRSTLPNEKQDFFRFLPHLVIQLNKKLRKSRQSHPCIGICCAFGGEIFLHF